MRSLEPALDKGDLNRESVEKQTGNYSRLRRSKIINTDITTLSPAIRFLMLQRNICKRVSQQ